MEMLISFAVIVLTLSYVHFKLAKSNMSRFALARIRREERKIQK